MRFELAALGKKSSGLPFELFLLRICKKAAFLCVTGFCVTRRTTTHYLIDISEHKFGRKRNLAETVMTNSENGLYCMLQVLTTQLAKMSVDLKFVELTADVLDFFS